LLIIPIAMRNPSNEIMPEHHLHGLYCTNSDLYRFGQMM
jgi:hypothetical protein